MIRLLYKPCEFKYIAVSGGMDSMVLTDFCTNKKTIVHFDHGTEFGSKAKKFVVDYANDNDIPLICGEISRSKISSESWEEYWRNQRYEFFDSIDGTIALAHHLDDATETYLFYALSGQQWTIPPCRGKYIRPFLITPQNELAKWASRKGILFLDDPSNYDEKYSRSKIRHNLMPIAESINPGIRTVVKKKILEIYNKTPCMC